MICLPNSSFIKPTAFLFFPIGNCLSTSWFEVLYLLLTYSEISLYFRFLYGQWNYLCPNNTILPFHHILTSYNHTKICTLQFCLCLISLIPNKQAYSWLFGSFLFLLQANFSRKTLWCNNLALRPNNFFFFVVTSLMPLYYLWFSFELFIIFCFILNLLFISIYGFNHSSWLKLIALWTFFRTRPCFSTCFRFLYMGFIFSLIF